jgi:hypothetical protein
VGRRERGDCLDITVLNGRVRRRCGDGRVVHRRLRRRPLKSWRLVRRREDTLVLLRTRRLERRRQLEGGHRRSRSRRVVNPIVKVEWVARWLGSQ